MVLSGFAWEEIVMSIFLNTNGMVFHLNYINADFVKMY